MRDRTSNVIGALPGAVATMRAVRRPCSPSGRSMSNVSWPVRPSVCAFWPSMNCRGSTPMPIRFERWMRSKLSAMTAFTPSSIVPLAAQSREEPVPYSLPAMMISGVPSLL